MEFNTRLPAVCGVVIALSGCGDANVTSRQSHSPLRNTGPASANAPAVEPAAMLAAHNRWRAMVGVPPLVYSAALAGSAQAWAERLRDGNHCQMRHSHATGLGENLFWASARKWSNGIREIQRIGAREVVDAWGSERADYNVATNRCKPGAVCGHYTQLVWRTTTAVGCGAALCPDSREQVWVCHYTPPGNYVGRRPY